MRCQCPHCSTIDDVVEETQSGVVLGCRVCGKPFTTPVAEQPTKLGNFVYKVAITLFLIFLVAYWAMRVVVSPSLKRDADRRAEEILRDR